MKAFEGKNFYEILNLPPNADLADIKQAYAEAIEMYDEESLSTYSLFTDEQRKKLLQDIDEAFQTLSNADKRAEYNQMLISSGQVEAAMFSPQPQDSAQERGEEELSPEPEEPAEQIEQLSNEEKIRKILDTITEKGLVSGEDLRQLREARGIEIPEIFEKTRISKTTLGRIEENQYEDLPAEIFLKAFLKSYAEIIQIDPKCIVDGYLKYMASGLHEKSYILNIKPGK